MFWRPNLFLVNYDPNSRPPPTNQKSADNHAHRTILFSLVCNVHHYMKKQEGREGLNDFPYVYVLCGGGLELYHCLYPRYVRKMRLKGGL